MRLSFLHAQILKSIWGPLHTACRHLLAVNVRTNLQTSPCTNKPKENHIQIFVLLHIWCLLFDTIIMYHTTLHVCNTLWRICQSQCQRSYSRKNASAIIMLYNPRHFLHSFHPLLCLPLIDRRLWHQFASLRETKIKDDMQGQTTGQRC